MPYLQFCTVQEAYNALREFELKTTTKFAVYKATKNFGSNEFTNDCHLNWEDAKTVKYCRLDFNGTPFAVLGRKVFDCHNGRDRHEKSKKKKMESKETDHGYGKNPTFLALETKKVDCPAKVYMKEVVKFPLYKIGDSRSRINEKKVKEKLLHDLMSKVDIGAKKVILCYLPDLSEHEGHPVGDAAGLSDIDERLVVKIREHYQQGVRSVNEMKIHLRTYVKSICPTLPQRNSKRFYPSNKTISNHMLAEEQSEQVSALDEDNSEVFLIPGSESQEVRQTKATPSTLVTYALRLNPGEEIVSRLQQFVEENQLKAAFIISCVGSVTQATLRMADSVTIKYYIGNREIVSLVGTLSAGGHLHGSFSDRNGEVVGGHVVGDLFVYTTAEIIIGECSILHFTREDDEQTGYKELVVTGK